jgi:hypothetical protein
MPSLPEQPRIYNLLRVQLHLLVTGNCIPNRYGYIIRRPQLCIPLRVPQPRAQVPVR